MTKWDSSQVHKDSSPYANQSNYTKLKKEIHQIKKRKVKNYISIDAEKASDKF